MPRHRSLFARTPLLVAAAVAGGALLSPPLAEASPLQILPFGDSITFGTGSTTVDAPDTDEYRNFVDKYYEGTTADYTVRYSDPPWTARGYRVYLQQLLDADGVNYDFVGNRGAGHGSMDYDHWAAPGARLSVNRIGGDYERPVPSLAQAMRNVELSLTNYSIEGNNYDISDKNHGQVAFNPSITKPTNVLVHGGTNDMIDLPAAQAGFDDLLDAMYERYVDGHFASGVQLLIAQIIPDPQSEARLNNSSLFNSYIETTVSDWLNDDDLSKRDFASHITLVDMENILLDDLDLSWIASLFGIGDVAQLNDDLDVDGDGYLDWVIGTSRNTNLFSDDVHPNDLGYAVMANVWHNSLAVPEPASLVLLGLGAGLMFGRRRWRA